MSVRKVRRTKLPPRKRAIDPVSGPGLLTSPQPGKRLPFPRDRRSKARNRMRLALLATTLGMFLFARFFPEQTRLWMDEHGVGGRLVLLGFLAVPAIVAYRSAL